MTMFRTVSGALTIYAGDPRPVHFPFFDAAGVAQSLSGRSFVFTVRRDILTQAIFDPIPMILSNDGFYVTAPITADQATAIYEAGVGYPIVYDVIETTAGASTTRWTGRIEALPSTALPSDAPPRWVDLPVAELVSDGPVIRVSERGAAGPGVEQRLKDLGDIPEADPALMRDKIREWGGEGGAPFAEAAGAAAQAAGAAAQAAGEARQQAESLVEPVQDIVSRGAQVIPRPMATEPEADSLGAYLNLRTMFKTKAIAQSTLIASSVDLIEAMNFDTNEVEGSRALYRRVNSEPSHPGKIQTAGGQWWEIADKIIRPEMFGAFGFDDVARMLSDTVGVQTALRVSARIGRIVECPTATYIIDGYKGENAVWTAGDLEDGGILIRAGTVLVGAGMGKTIFKNGADNWRSMFRVRDPARTELRNFTIDGDWPNRQPIANLYPDTTSTPTSGPINGVGLLYQATTGTGAEIDARYIEIRNTADYGIGVEDMKVNKGYIGYIHLYNIGADGIDVKWFSSPDLDKNLIIEKIFGDRACGQNFIAKGTPVGNDGQAVVDIGGKCHVRDIHVINFGADPDATGNSAVRLRTAVPSQNRKGADGSVVESVFVLSSKPVGQGDAAGPYNLIGVDVNASNVSVSGVYAENCRVAVEVAPSGELATGPVNVSVSDVVAVNCTGASDKGFGLTLAASVNGAQLSNIRTIGCDNGILLAGTNVSIAGLHMAGCKIGYTANDKTGASFANYTITGLTRSGNILDTDVQNISPQASFRAAKGAEITGSRELWQDFLSTANDSGWTGEAAWIGGSRYKSLDVSGGIGIRGRTGFRSIGATGTNFEWVAQVGPNDMIRATPNELGFFGVTPVARPTINGSRGGNVALGNLLTRLEQFGLIINATTA